MNLTHLPSVLLPVLICLPRVCFFCSFTLLQPACSFSNKNPVCMSEQALAHQPSMFPGKLFREMVLEALVAQPQDGDALADEQGLADSSPGFPSSTVVGGRDKRNVAPKRYRQGFDCVTAACAV